MQWRKIFESFSKNSQQIIGVNATWKSGSDGLREALLRGAASFCRSSESHPAQAWVNVLKYAKMTNDSTHSYMTLAFSTIQTQTCTAEHWLALWPSSCIAKLQSGVPLEWGQDEGAPLRAGCGAKQYSSSVSMGDTWHDTCPCACFSPGLCGTFYWWMSRTSNSFV